MPTLGLTIAPASVSDDPEEWYGLEYTLELSSRSRQPSDTQSFSAGEHSKVNFVPLSHSLFASGSLTAFDRVENLGQPFIKGVFIHPLKMKITINGRLGIVC